MNLVKQALLGILKLVLLMAVLLFVSAWSFAFWQAWLFLGVFSLCLVVITLDLAKNDPKLMERRMHAGVQAEKLLAQQIIICIANVVSCFLMIIPGLDHRFGWSSVPLPLVIGGNLMLIVGAFAVIVVFRENSFSASTIQIAEDQRVISTGPYALVRHPMYASSLVMTLGALLALASWWAVLLIIPMTAIIIARLQDEEKYLLLNLDGYEKYIQTVRWRLLPGVW